MMNMSLKLVTNGELKNKSAIVRIMVLCRTGDMELPEATVAKVTGTSTCHLVSICDFATRSNFNDIA